MVYRQRVRDMVEVLVSAFERVDAPVDHAGVALMARAAVAVSKAIEVAYSDEPVEDEDDEDEDEEDEDEDEGEEMEGGHEAGRTDAVDAWGVILERKLARLALRRKNEGLDYERDFDPDQLSHEVDRLAAGSAGPARR